MNILGVSAFYHDSAACLVRDGVIVAAAQEERFTRKKHDDRFPAAAVAACLADAGITAGDLDLVAFYDKPLLKFDRLLETYLAYAPAGFGSFRRVLPLWLKRKLYLPRELDRGLGGQYRGRYVFTEHHESHAASAFFPSPFAEAAILTLDGVGEWATGSWGVGRGNRITITRELRFPHSLGLLYSAFTYFCGFRVNSGEYKLMGLAPYGKPRYADLILDKLMDLKPDGSFRLDMRYFDYCAGQTMTNRRFANLFDGPPRTPEGPITQRETDLAASVQWVTEEVMLCCAREVARQTGLTKLAMAGGVALNCVANTRLLREGPFNDIWVQPAAGDAGGALGAALFVWHQLLDRPREAAVGDRMHGALLGPRFDNDAVQKALDARGAKYTRYRDEGELLSLVAAALAAGKVVGWFQGRMEFGPRALGCRSILGDARRPETQSEMNLKTKFRESFRPFAPSVLREYAHEWFDNPAGFDAPYMLFTAFVRPEKRLAAQPTDDNPTDLGRRLNASRSAIPAVTHVDYSARLQTVDEARHGRYYRLLGRFHELTGCPVLVNTSFNVRGEPIVGTPDDAYRCFLATNIDLLVIEDFVLRKADQPAAVRHEIDAYLARRELD